MKDLKELKFVLGESYKSPFVNEIGVFRTGQYLWREIRTANSGR